MDDIETRVLAAEMGAELKGLTVQVEKGFADLKDLIKSGAITLNEHIKEDKEKFNELDKELEKLKIDMAKFKERWLLIGAGISLVGATLIQLITNAIAK